ncbi:MAG: hypothetical protein HeimC2_11920 [Candidatus Heimdallarchaeota archaeon LC_2]|nr:MAG: hypothetical protein HeimC2_11920 [Candidatus Heimdallarchaeota archaeon LC_2]
MINIDRAKIKIEKYLINNLIDTVFENDQIFLLNNEHNINVVNYRSGNVFSIKLSNVKHKASCITIDSSNIYVGYVNGTVEVLDKNNSYESIKITSPDDAGGPGNPHVLDILSTQTYLLVNTKENGLLIYLQPSILFYKWIMIELETSIISFSYDHQQLFVLVKDGSLHKLDFIAQRIDEIPIGGFSFIDLEYHNNYLFLASKHSLYIYEVKNGYTLVFTFREKLSEILKITTNGNYLFLLLKQGKLRVIEFNNFTQETNFNVFELIVIDKKFPIFEKMNYSKINFQNNDIGNLEKIEFFYLKENILRKAIIRFEDGY